MIENFQKTKSKDNLEDTARMSEDKYCELVGDPCYRFSRIVK